MTRALDAIEGGVQSIRSQGIFEYHFADQEYAKKFGDEERIGRLAAVFTALAILISCLGLFGLSAFVAEQRTREVGIRKVLGASVFTLWRLSVTGVRRAGGSVAAYRRAGGLLDHVWLVEQLSLSCRSVLVDLCGDSRGVIVDHVSDGQRLPGGQGGAGQSGEELLSSYSCNS